MCCDWSHFLNSGTIFSLPTGELWLAWELKGQQSHAPADQKAIYAPDFFLEEPLPWYTWVHWSKWDREKLLRELPPLPAQPEISWDPIHKKAFHETFHRSMEQILAGKIQKAVPVLLRSGQAQMDSSAVLYFLHHLLTLPKELRLFGLWHHGEGILGATPEVLFELRNRTFLTTMALAGTGERTNVSSLLESTKDQKEHNIVVESILQSLRQYGEVSCAKTELFPFHSLEHLRTDIELKGHQPLDFEKMVSALHPTPALGVFPKGSSNASILRNLSAGFPRRRFGAPFALCWPGGSDASCLVAIRNLQWSHNHLYLGSGYGLIRESGEEQEWNELLAKSQAVQVMLGL